jgi:hypothetical protein
LVVLMLASLNILSELYQSGQGAGDVLL